VIVVVSGAVVTRRGPSKMFKIVQGASNFKIKCASFILNCLINIWILGKLKNMASRTFEENVGIF
jgi:hypothetical protein